MIANDVMTTPVYFISPNETIAYARNLMVKHKISRILVMQDGRLTGILTKKDIAYRLHQAEPAWRRRPVDQITVGEFATPGPVVVSLNTGIREIAAIFSRNTIELCAGCRCRERGGNSDKNRSDEIRYCTCTYL